MKSLEVLRTALEGHVAGWERLLFLDAFVCHLTGPLPTLPCGPEVADAFWAPVSAL